MHCVENNPPPTVMPATCGLFDNMKLIDYTVFLTKKIPSVAGYNLKHSVIYISHDRSRTSVGGSS